jgi:iron complex transport system ATP-binding protein
LTEPGRAILTADAVKFGFSGRPEFLGPISLRVVPGECWGIIGPNGAGKSTLLRLLAGIVPPKSGVIALDGTPLSDINGRSRARRIAFLPQNPSREAGLTAREVVLMGRYPHRQFGLFESPADFAIADESLAATQTSKFAGRALSTLSGGEAQRVHVAAALAQRPAVMMLDEPTSSLDLYHQLAIFSTVRRLVDEQGLAAVIVTHDLNLAAKYCTRAILLDEGRVVAQGIPSEVITPQHLEPVYRVRLAVVGARDDADQVIIPLGMRHDREDMA